MGVANDVTVAIQVLGGRVIGSVGIRERARSEVIELDLDLEVLVGLDVIIVLRVDDNGRNHVGLGRDVAHHYKVLE